MNLSTIRANVHERMDLFVIEGVKNNRRMKKSSNRTPSNRRLNRCALHARRKPQGAHDWRYEGHRLDRHHQVGRANASLRAKRALQPDLTSTSLSAEPTR